MNYQATIKGVMDGVSVGLGRIEVAMDAASLESRSNGRDGTSDGAGSNKKVIDDVSDGPGIMCVLFLLSIPCIIFRSFDCSVRFVRYSVHT